jgi:hypothetical protein
MSSLFFVFFFLLFGVLMGNLIAGLIYLFIWLCEILIQAVEGLYVKIRKVQKLRRTL